MKNIYLLVIILISTSCAYKPRLLINSENSSLDTNACFVLGEGIKNRQKIFYIVDNGLRGYHGNRELMFYYDLNQFILTNIIPCHDTIKFKIVKINSNSLYFSDTAVVADGFKLSMTIDFIKNGISIDQRTFELQDRVPLYSAYTATKKRIDRKMVSIMNDVFTELSRKVYETGQSL